MAQVITANDGRIVGFTPTMDQGDIDRVRKAQEAENKRGEKWLAEEEKRRESIAQAQPKDDERRRATIVGLRRHSRKASREGEKKKGEMLKLYADEAEQALDAYDEETKKLQAKRPDPIGDATQKATKELRKLLPACFPSDLDAERFAQKLPMVEAVAEAGRLADAFAKTSRTRGKYSDQFWQIVQKGGRLAFGSIDDDANVRQLVAAGV